MIKTSQAEYGRVNVILDNREDIFYGFSNNATCWMSHQDLIENFPPNFKAIAHSENTKAAAMANKEKKIYGVQFHPEVSHTPLGKKLLENFFYRICQCQPSWNLEPLIEQSVKEIKEKVGKGMVVAGVSGGIDLLVAAVLTHKAIGNQLYCIFINNGLLRKGEADEIIKQEIKKNNSYKKIWQSFGILLPIKTVGVMGDVRTYDFVLALRIVTSNDGMTADWAKISYKVLGEISNRIINEVKGINRVVYDISSKPPATIEWE